MTEDNLLYGITLEDYSKPRSKNDNVLYCGTAKEIWEFIAALCKKEWTRDRYAKMILAFANSTDEKPVQYYHMGGNEYSTCHWMHMIYLQEDFLKDHYWECTTYDESIYNFYASKVIVSRMIAKDPENVYRFIRVRFTGLQVNLQGQGWVALENQSQGFPCTYFYEEENDEHIMNLYVCDATYEVHDQRRAIRELKNVEEIDLTRATLDILGEGIYE